MKILKSLTRKTAWVTGAFMLLWFLSVSSGTLHAAEGYIDTHNHAPINPNCDYNAMVDYNGDGILEAYDSVVEDVVVANMDNYDINFTLFMPEPRGVDNAPFCEFEHLAEIVKNFPGRFAMLLGGESLNVMIQQVVKGVTTSKL